MSRRATPPPATPPMAAADVGDVVRLKPYQYIHVHDNNANVTRVVLGPFTFTKQDHEQILTPPMPCIHIPPRCYCIIENPVLLDARGQPVKDRHGQAKVRLGDREIRFEQQPFALYPQERLFGDTVHQLKVLPDGKALRLKALRDFEVAGEGTARITRQAGDEWLFEGPGTYIPRIEVDITEEMSATVLKPNTGLLLRARNACVDRTGKPREAGEEWLHVGVGSYLPGVDEEITKIVEATILTDTNALHLEALRTFTDVFGKERKAGEQWLITNQESASYIIGPNERMHGLVPLTVLSSRQFCIVLDPWRGGRQALGQKEVRRGRGSFFLHPGETLEDGIQEVFVLTADEALLLVANESFADVDDKGAEVNRKPGDRWMIYGPREYVPNTAVTVVERRRSIALDENEGIYVRDMRSGQVRAVIGQTYMLAPDEELWEKDIPPLVFEKILAQGNVKDYMDPKKPGNKGKPVRDATRVVTYSAPHNTVVQVYDYKSKKPRIVFGPDMVKLGPEEQFTMVHLSGAKPKRPNVITTLSVSLGPDFMTDIITVETSDHARLSLQLAYSWLFDVKYGDYEAATKVFNVADFVGDACSAIASRIRGAVAAQPFDLFHKNSSSIIKEAVFGLDKATKQPKEMLVFKNNSLIITSVDIQSVEPVDTKTRDALMKSVQLAIEITTKSQEATARHDAERREQVARGELERQVLNDRAQAEKERKMLLQYQAESAAIESTGASKAEAKAQAAAAAIDGESQVDLARLKAQAVKIATDAELEAAQERKRVELDFQEQMSALEVEKQKALSEIEAMKFSACVQSIGPETIDAMARAGPEMQAKLLKGLGLQGYLLTDGNSPINLMNAANSLTGISPQ